jgi:plastocyanin
MVTAVDKGADGKQTVRACPTGQQNYDCFEAVYGSDGKMITVNVIQITVTVVNGESITKTITKNGGAPQVTPGPEPKLNIVNGNVVADDVVTKVIDTTVTSTKNGKTVLLTSTHTTVIRGTGTGSASNSKPTHHVKVGANHKMEFDPPTLKAKAGDVIRFNFFPKNHSVTACSAQDPCMENGAFDSGFKHTFIQNSTQAVYYTVENATSPQVMFS